MENQYNNDILKKKQYRQKHNKTYYENNKQTIISYIIEYNSNRRKTDPEYKQRVNEYVKNRYKYDDEARQKKREYYLKKKQKQQ